MQALPLAQRIAACSGHDSQCRDQVQVESRKVIKLVYGGGGIVIMLAKSKTCCTVSMYWNVLPGNALSFALQ